jgi:hypothetical protein
MGWLLLVDVIDLFVRSIDELVAVSLTDGSPESVGNSSDISLPYCTDLLFFKAICLAIEKSNASESESL